MVKRVALSILLALLCGVLLSCKPVTSLLHDNKIPMTIQSNGASVEVSRITVGNFNYGSRAEGIFVVKNDTSEEITPDFYFFTMPDPWDGYEYPDPKVLNYVMLPDVKPIPPHQKLEFAVVLYLPKSAMRVPDKWEFDVGVTGDKGVVTAGVGVRFLINMR